MMTDKYSVFRNNWCWSLVFFILLNVFSVNSYVLYAHNPKTKLKRCVFTEKACSVLLEDISLQKLLWVDIIILLPGATDASTSQSLHDHLKRCIFWFRSKDQMVKTTCNTWKKHICRDLNDIIKNCINREKAAAGGKSECKIMAL